MQLAVRRLLFLCAKGVEIWQTKKICQSAAEYCSLRTERSFAASGSTIGCAAFIASFVDFMHGHIDVLTHQTTASTL